jgi:hypothetical protein
VVDKYVQIFEAAILAGHKYKVSPQQDEYYNGVLNLMDELLARDRAVNST